MFNIELNTILYVKHENVLKSVHMQELPFLK